MGTEALAARLAEAIDAGDELSIESQRRLFAGLVRLYAASRRAEAGPPFAEGTVAVEDAVLTAAEILKAAHVTSFELAALFNV